MATQFDVLLRSQEPMALYAKVADITRNNWGDTAAAPVGRANGGNLVERGSFSPG